MNELFNKLNKVVDEGWQIIKAGKFWNYVMNNEVPIELYRQAMLQVYHYTKYNSVNQAACAYSANPNDNVILRFVYKHALEELGHQNMVIKDLTSIDAMPKMIPPPLEPTQALISYLNDVALRVGPVARLGYSYWAEEVYDHIQPLLNKFRQDLKLKDEDMTFFVAHSNIDEKHAQEVKDAMERVVKTKEDQEAIIEVAKVTLYLTGQLLEESYRSYFNSREVGEAKVA